MTGKPLILLDASLYPDPDANQELGPSELQEIADEKTGCGRLVVSQRSIRTVQMGSSLGGSIELLCSFHPSFGARYSSARLAFKLLAPKGVLIADLQPRQSRPPTTACVIRASGESTSLALWTFVEEPINSGLGAEYLLSLDIPATGTVVGVLSISARVVRQGLPGVKDRVIDLINGRNKEERHHPIRFLIPKSPEAKKSKRALPIKPQCRILFLSADPGPVRLRSGSEVRAIQQRLRASIYRDSFLFQTEWAVQPEDVAQYLSDHRPHVVHFSGHGSLAEKLILEGDEGQTVRASKEALEELFAIMGEHTRLVVLNSCFSHSIAEAITRHVDCAIGTSKPIRDSTARKFAAELYGALGSGDSIERAFERSRVTLLLGETPSENVPLLSVREGVDPKSIILADLGLKQKT